MIKVLIIEDEIPARKKLKRFLEQLDTPVDIVAEIDTVVSAIQFLESNRMDVIFSDIELLDGSAFDIYGQVPTDCPIIFTTAYDQFWMNAFESNGIAYLLKPFSQERFQKAWDKFLVLRKSASPDSSLLSKLKDILESNPIKQSYKKRFTITTRQGIYFVETEDILFFSVDAGVVVAIDNTGKKHVLNETTLHEIGMCLNPQDFFRINRSELVHKKYIEKLERYSKNVLAIKIKGYEDYLKTSQSNTADFRAWLEK